MYLQKGSVAVSQHFPSASFLFSKMIFMSIYVFRHSLTHPHQRSDVLHNMYRMVPWTDSLPIVFFRCYLFRTNVIFSQGTKSIVASGHACMLRCLVNPLFWNPQINSAYAKLLLSGNNNNSPRPCASTDQPPHFSKPSQSDGPSSRLK